MQEPFRNKKNRGYRLRPASGRDRLDSRVRRLCSRLGILAVVVAAAIVIRSLYNIQIIHGAEYRQYAAQQQLLDTTIKATRGEIYDASGITLASTSVVWTIWADPSYSSILYTSKTNDDDTVTKTLDPAMCAEVSRELTLRLLSGDGESMDSVDTSSAEYQQQYQTVYDALSRLDSAYVTLATKVNNAVKLSIEKYVTSFNKTHKKATDTSRKGRISVSSEKSFQRNYPYGAFAAAVLGFTDADGIGTYGLEKSYQSTLAGVDGRTITRRNAVGNAIADQNATTFAAKDGSNLVLSLDVNVQEIAERYLNEAIAANTVENRGCAIVMNVKTGAILAMASKPIRWITVPIWIISTSWCTQSRSFTASIKRTPTATTSPMNRATKFWTRKQTIPATTGISCGKTRPSPSCTTPALCSRSLPPPWASTPVWPP